MVVELYQKQLLFAKLRKMRGKFWFSELWPRVSNITVALVANFPSANESLGWGPENSDPVLVPANRQVRLIV